MHIQFGAPGQPAMYFPSTPKTVAERVADWRERHPERVAAYNAQRRAQRQAWKAAQVALQAERFAARQAELVKTPLLLPAPPVRLCLPAPLEEPMFILPVERPEPVLVEAAAREEVRACPAA
jgi:hypothetical protein